MTDLVLDVKHLQVAFKRYHSTLEQLGTATVKDVTLQVKKQSIVAIVGASGAGKSILAHAILGILPKNAEVTGEISFLGETLSANRKAQLRGKEISLIPQSIRYLDPILKIKDQLAVTSFPKKKLIEVVEDLQLDASILECYPYQLSGGMARRVLFATAVLTHPKLIVADEPTPGMGLKQAVHALAILKQRVKEEGTAVLLITHDIDLALNFADEIVFFEDGKTIDRLTPKEFIAGPTKDWQSFTEKMWHALPQNGFIG